MRHKTGIDTIVHDTFVLGATVSLLLPVALHGENLYEANEDVDHIEFESDRLPDGVPGNSTCLGHTSVVQDFLSVVENETAEHGETTVQRNGLSDREATHAQRECHRSERAQRHDGDTGEERPTHVQILVVLGCSPHVGQGTDDAACVQRGSSQQCGGQEE